MRFGRRKIVSAPAAAALLESTLYEVSFGTTRAAGGAEAVKRYLALLLRTPVTHFQVCPAAVPIECKGRKAQRLEEGARGYTSTGNGHRAAPRLLHSAAMVWIILVIRPVFLIHPPLRTPYCNHIETNVSKNRLFPFLAFCRLTCSLYTWPLVNQTQPNETMTKVGVTQTVSVPVLRNLLTYLDTEHARDGASGISSTCSKPSIHTVSTVEQPSPRMKASVCVSREGVGSSLRKGGARPPPGCIGREVA